MLVDNPSWILPYAEDLVERLASKGDNARLVRRHEDLQVGDVAFLLGCIRILPATALKLHRRNLVVHESALPEGRGFAPLTWQILEGRDEIPVCLIEAENGADLGGIVLRDTLRFEGHELGSELRHAQGRLTIEMCLRFMAAKTPLPPEPQLGEATNYPRRRPEDSRLDPSRSLAEQFSLLRVVDNDRYPAFFDWQGRRYVLRIEKAEEISSRSEGDRA